MTDGHLRLGVAAGDHAVMLWPLLCGMAKAKLYLLTARFIDGKEAERIGLVSICAPAERLMDTAWEIANELAAGGQPALRFTKRALNQWLRMAGPAFDHSLALEMLTFLGPDCAEGLQALKDQPRGHSLPPRAGARCQPTRTGQRRMNGTYSPCHAAPGRSCGDRYTKQSQVPTGGARMPDGCSPGTRGLGRRDGGRE